MVNLKQQLSKKQIPSTRQRIGQRIAGQPLKQRRMGMLPRLGLTTLSMASIASLLARNPQTNDRLLGATSSFLGFLGKHIPDDGPLTTLKPKINEACRTIRQTRTDARVTTRNNKLTSGISNHAQGHVPTTQATGAPTA